MFSGFSGDRCQEGDDPCLNDPCANGGTCSSNGTEFTCECDVG